jgi:hypothetical protein
MMEQHDEFDVERNQQEWSSYITDNALFYLEKLEFNLVDRAREYNAALTACEGQSLGIASHEVDRAWASGTKFWKEFEAYQVRCAEHMRNTVQDC